MALRLRASMEGTTAPLSARDSGAHDARMRAVGRKCATTSSRDGPFDRTGRPSSSTVALRRRLLLDADHGARVTPWRMPMRPNHQRAAELASRSQMRRAHGLRGQLRCAAHRIRPDRGRHPRRPETRGAADAAGRKRRRQPCSSSPRRCGTVGIRLPIASSGVRR